MDNYVHSPCKEICRICMGKFNDLLPIFGKSKFISKKVMYIAKIQFQFTDGFPTQICRTCLKNLDIAYKFKKLCKKSDNYFRQITKFKDTKSNTESTIKDSANEKDIDEAKDVLRTDPKVDEISEDDYIEYPLIESPSPIDHKLEENDKEINKNNKFKSNVKSNSSVNNICEICGKSFETRVGLRSHIKRHQNLKPFKCELCPKAFKESGSLKIHIRSHTGERPYTCEFCSNSFTQKSVLKDHIRSHTLETPYKCKLCSKRFTTRSNYAKHTVAHKNERKFLCTICKASFNFNAGLKKHLLTHTDERPFKCTVCNKGFKRKTNLTIHMRVHSDELPFTCEICSKSFRYNCILKNHLKSKHDIIVPSMPVLANF